MFDLGWGEPVCVRQALKTLYTPKNKIDILSMGYAPDDGNELLIYLIQEYLRETTGISYKHVIITNGTTPAINVVLRVLKKEGISTIATNKYYFPYYSQIISKNGLKHRLKYVNNGIDTVNLIDYPSNPKGYMDKRFFNSDFSVWDSVYYNPVYVNSLTLNTPNHRVNVGSLSKVFGLTGLRIGYIATNRDDDAVLFSNENLYESCTISVPSQDIATDILYNLDIELFFKKAKASVNNNRETLSKIEYLLDGQKVPKNGMFYSAYADSKALEIIDCADVKYVVLSDDKDGIHIRFNLAQDNIITNNAVKAIKRKDSGR